MLKKFISAIVLISCAYGASANESSVEDDEAMFLKPPLDLEGTGKNPTGWSCFGDADSVIGRPNWCDKPLGVATKFAFLELFEDDIIEEVSFDIFPHTVTFANKYQRYPIPQPEEGNPLLKDCFILRVHFRTPIKKATRKVMDDYLTAIDTTNKTYEALKSLSHASDTEATEEPLHTPFLRLSCDNNVISVAITAPNKKHLRQLFETWLGLSDLMISYYVDSFLKEIHVLPIVGWKRPSEVDLDTRND